MACSESVAHTIPPYPCGPPAAVEDPILCDVLSFAETDAGISRITCTIAGDEDYIYEMSSSFMCEGFDLVIRLDHMTEYDFSEIADNKKLAPVIPHMPKEIKAEKDILEGEIRAYKNRLAQYGIKTADLTYDKDISRFYLKDGEIQNCMLFAMHDNVPEMIFTDAMLSVTDSIVTPGLLVSCVNAIWEQNADSKNYKDKPDNANLIVALRSVNKYLGSHDGARKTPKGRERLYLMETVQRGLLSALRNNTKPDSYPDPEAGQYCSDTEHDLADYTAREDISTQYKEVQSKLVEYRNKTCSFDDVIAAAEKCSAAHKSSQNRDKYFYSDTIDKLIAHKDQIKALRVAALKEKGISAEFDKIYRISPNGELTVNEDELKKINMTLSKTQIDGKNTAERLNVFKLLSMLPDSDNVLKADIADAERKFALMVKTHTRTINEGEIYMSLDAIDHKIDDCVTAHSLKDADKNAIEHDIAIYRMLKKYYLKSFEYKQKKS